MFKITLLGALGILLPSVLVAQNPTEPGKLPGSLTSPKAKVPLLDPEKQLKEDIKNLKEELLEINPQKAVLAEVEGRWVIKAGETVAKEFGRDRKAAEETLRVWQDYEVTQIGIIPGSKPPFEYWLASGKAMRPGSGKRTVLNVRGKSVDYSNVGGTWVVHDGSKVLFNFEDDEIGARLARTVYRKYQFNQMVLIGSPQPTVIYPMFDQVQADRDERIAYRPQPLNVVQEVAQAQLLLPGNVNGGTKIPVDLKKLDVVKTDEYQLVLGTTVLGRFGINESQASAAAKAILDSRATEMVLLGQKKIPIFLRDGNAINSKPLGAACVTINADRLRIVQFRDSYWLYEESRPLLDVGTKADAELLYKVISSLGINTLCLYGRAPGYSLILLTKTR